jgi:hypothetical protein
MISKAFLAISHHNFLHFYQNTTFLSQLDTNSGEYKNLILFMPYKKKTQSTSSFLFMAFGLIFLSIMPILRDFLVLGFKSFGFSSWPLNIKTP